MSAFDPKRTSAPEDCCHANRKNSAVIGTQKSQAWTGPATLCLLPNALAPVAERPVVEVASAIHICADLTLGFGEVVHDNRPEKRSALKRKFHLNAPSLD